jgi:hypothetical protein
VTIQGATYSQSSVARVLSRLSVVPTLADLRLTASALVEPQAEQSRAPGEKPTSTPKRQGKKVVTFTITGSIRTESSS